MIKVSIITPAYNQAKFVGETVGSVLSQDYPNIEYIVLDDGSTDETQEVIKPYLDKLKYIRHANIGESRTVNKGYRQCNGDIVGVVNSDDPLYTPDAVTRIVRCFQDHPDTLAVYPDWVSIDESGSVIEWMEVPQYSIENMVKKFDVRLGPGMFIKRAALDSIGYRNESLKYTGDLDVSFRLALLGKITHVKGFLATHRVHSQAASSVAKGDLMATEVVRLVKVTLKSPLLPQSLLHEKQRLLGYAYLVSTYYTKPYGFGYFKNIARALLMNPSLIKDFFRVIERTRFVKCFGFLRRPCVGHCCYRIYLYLPLSFRNRILRQVKKIWRVCPVSFKHVILKILRFWGFNL